MSGPIELPRRVETVPFYKSKRFWGLVLTGFGLWAGWWVVKRYF